LTINYNTNCVPLFELIPGATFSVSVALAGPWVGSVTEVAVDRYGNLVVPDSPRIQCGPAAGANVCIADLPAGDSPYTVIRLVANALPNAPAGAFHWTCQQPFPDDPAAAPVVLSVASQDVAIGPIFGNTSCSVDFVPAP
jgi:hypothetical protein